MAKTYSEKLRDPRWQKKRLEILNRDCFTCTICGDDKEELHIHHLEYHSKKDPWDYDPQFLKTYCKHCHWVVEYCKNEFNGPVIAATKLKRKSSEEICLLSIVKEKSDTFLIAFRYHNNEYTFWYCFNKNVFEKIYTLFENSGQIEGWGEVIQSLKPNRQVRVNSLEDIRKKYAEKNQKSF